MLMIGKALVEVGHSSRLSVIECLDFCQSPVVKSTIKDNLINMLLEDFEKRYLLESAKCLIACCCDHIPE